MKEIKKRKNLSIAQTSKLRKYSLSDEDEGWFELANYDGELSQTKDYLEARFHRPFPENLEGDREFFKSLTIEPRNKKISILRVDFYLPMFNLKFYDSAEGIRSKNKINKDLILKIHETNIAMQALETNEFDLQKNVVSKIKYSILGTVKQIVIEDNLKDSIYEHLLRFEENSLAFYFRINETVTEFVNTTDEQIVTKRRSSSFKATGSGFGTSEEDSVQKRRRLMSEETS